VKAKVLRILTRLAAGGPPLHSVLLTREMAKLGYETHLAVGECRDGEREMTYLLSEGDPVIRVPGLAAPIAPLRDLWALLRLIVIMRRLRPDIVHTHTAKAGALGRLAARLAGVPVVVHTFHGHVLEGYFPQWINRLIGKLERRLAFLTDRICVLSASQARELSAALDVPVESKFEVVPLGFDLEGFVNLADPKDPFTVGWLGRFVPVKNLDLLKCVVEQTLRQAADIRFLIAGEGPEEWKMREVAARYPANVTLYPWCEDVRPLIARCHILTLTSRQEGTPVAIVQGMAARRPFVATNAGGIPDLAGEGQRGICCPADARLLAGEILGLARNPERRRELGRNASEYAQAVHSRGRLTQDLDNLYQALLRERAHPFSHATTRSES
jgi:glycosyltransferase involved in cell wall biosynthesis